MMTQRPLRLLVAVAVLVLAVLLLRGYVTDDTFIHLRYAQNLLELGEFSFNPGERTYGATSPLWICGLMLLLKIGLSPLTAAWLLGSLSGLLMLLLLDALLAELPWSDAWRAAVLWLAACDAWFLRWSQSGMETPLASAALLLLLWPLVSRGGGRGGLRRGDPGGRQLYLAWGVGAGLAGLARPEFILLGPAALPWLLWYVRRGEGVAAAGIISRILAAAVGWLLALGPWLAVSYGLFGRLIPETATAKSYGLTLAPAAVVSSLFRSTTLLGATQGFLWLAILALAALALTARTRREAEAGQASPLVGWAIVGIAATWSVLLAGGYAVKQVWVISRYLSPLTPVLLLALAHVAGVLSDSLPSGGPWRRGGVGVLATGCVLSLLANGWLLVGKVRPHTREFSRGVRECYLDMGVWLRDHSPPDALVAALDIGAVGYGSERRVLDLMGLVSPEILAVGRQVGFEAMVASGAWLEVAVPDYLVDRTEDAPRWVDRQLHGVHFELLRTCVVRGVGLREPQPWNVALYHLTPVVDSPGPRRGRSEAGTGRQAGGAGP
jgi:hypothetical protein